MAGAAAEAGAAEKPAEILTFATADRSAYCDAAAGGTHARKGLPEERIAA
jgi:hypothetical protein